MLGSAVQEPAAGPGFAGGATTEGVGGGAIGTSVRFTALSYLLSAPVEESTIEDKPAVK
jgi:hypothetical protein